MLENIWSYLLFSSYSVSAHHGSRPVVRLLLGLARTAVQQLHLLLVGRHSDGLLRTWGLLQRLSGRARLLLARRCREQHGAVRERRLQRAYGGNSALQKAGEADLIVVE